MDTHTSFSPADSSLYQGGMDTTIISQPTMQEHMIATQYHTDMNTDSGISSSTTTHPSHDMGWNGGGMSASTTNCFSDTGMSTTTTNYSTDTGMSTTTTSCPSNDFTSDTWGGMSSTTSTSDAF